MHQAGKEFKQDTKIVIKIIVKLTGKLSTSGRLGVGHFKGENDQVRL
jgi:hypothetical protein